jgi:sterol desaturase/sphingolipid hydroxylase (fatty acid hydroxylase superfamily)
LCFVLDDFAYYWAHRSGHRVRWFWASHLNHHTSQHYNLSTALRQTWTGFIAL